MIRSNWYWRLGKVSYYGAVFIVSAKKCRKVGKSWFPFFYPIGARIEEGPASAKHEWPFHCPGEAGAIREFEDSLDYLDSNSENPDSADEMWGWRACLQAWWPGFCPWDLLTLERKGWHLRVSALKSSLLENLSSVTCWVPLHFQFKWMWPH